MSWMLLPLKRYFEFSGRSRRKEYWMFTLGIVLVTVLSLAAFVVVGRATGNFGQQAPTDGATSTSLALVAVLALAYLAILVPSIAVQVRRLHDQDMSGWFVLLGFIPGVGGIITLVFMCIEGTAGPNPFGPDPKNPEDALRTVFR